MTDLEENFVLEEDQEIQADFLINVINTDHNSLTNRDLENQHPIGAITGLQDALDRKQNVLVSGENIRTINGNSLLGSGDISVSGSELFKAGWTVNSTTLKFLQDVYSDADASVGMIYIGELMCSDLPENMGNAEALMEIMPSSTSDPKVIHLTLTSGTTDPYRWELSYYVFGGTVHNSGWIAFQPKMSAGTGINIYNNAISVSSEISSGSAAGLTAVQSVTTGSTNGTINVDGIDISVYGLGSAAYTESSAYDSYGSASTAETNAKNYADGLASNYATSAQGSLADTALQPSDVIDDVVSTDTDKPLSANMGKSLQDQVDNLKSRGRFLALWNCATGLAESNPPQSPYTYQSGDYFIVGTVSSANPPVNYKPSGSSYTTGVASSTVETYVVDVDDVYYYDGTNWKLQINTQKTVSFVNVAGNPYDNTNLASALNSKQNTLSLTQMAAVNSGATSTTVSLAESALQSGDNITLLTNNAGYITGITSTDVTTALGYTPYDSSNPSGYTSNVGTVTSVNSVSPVSGNVTLSIPTDTSDLTNGAGYITSSSLIGYQTTSNLVTSLSSSSTDTQYPSAKCVYDLVGDVETLINAL